MTHTDEDWKEAPGSRRRIPGQLRAATT